MGLLEIDSLRNWDTDPNVPSAAAWFGNSSILIDIFIYIGKAIAFSSQSLNPLNNSFCCITREPRF